MPVTLGRGLLLEVSDTQSIQARVREALAVAKDEEPEILTPQEAADLLRVSLLTVQRQAKAGRLPGRRVGKEWRFSRSVLLEWVGSGPDRHDLELYNRTERDERADQEGVGGEEQLEAEADCRQA